MRHTILLLALLAGVLASCTSNGDRVVPPSGVSTDVVAGDVERQRALSAALDTLEALVTTLEEVQDPIGAWNRAAEVSRLLYALERDRASYALGMEEEEAMQRFPEEVQRLQRLEAKRDIELNRIMADRAMAQVLLEEVAKADAERARRTETSVPGVDSAHSAR